MTVGRNDGKTGSFQEWVKRYEETHLGRPQAAPVNPQEPQATPEVSPGPEAPRQAPEPILPPYEQPGVDEPEDEITECSICFALVMGSRMSRHRRHHFANDASRSGV